MTYLFLIGGTNAIIATLLALIVWLATRVWRQPPLVHLLWVLVLVKLLTPPLVAIPWRVQTAKASFLVSETVLPKSMTAGPIINAPSALLNATDAALSNSSESSSGKTSVLPDDSIRLATAASSITADLDHSESDAESAGLSWIDLAMFAWVAGSIIWLMVVVGRLARFHRALARTAECPDDIRQLAVEAAAKLGVAYRIRLRLTDARISPLVWPIGRPTIMLSRPLIAELSRDELKTLIAHELAHLRRRDHWVRWLELAAATVYWWHPVVWWARHMIHKAEEQACDAWVVWAFPDAARRYATALFTATTMFADRRAPMVASRLGAGSNLKERIEDIMNGQTHCRLSLAARCAVLTLALVILPLSLRAVRAADGEVAPPKEAASSLQAAPGPAAAETAEVTAIALTPEEQKESIARNIEALQELVALDQADREKIAAALVTGDELTEAERKEKEAAMERLTTRLQALQAQIELLTKQTDLTEQQIVLTDDFADDVNADELAALSEHVEFLEAQFQKLDALYQTASRGGSADTRAMAGYELAAAQSELAVALGRRDEAIAYGQQAEKFAEECVKAVTASYEAGRRTHDGVLQAARNLSDSKRHVLRLREPNASTATAEQQPVVARRRISGNSGQENGEGTPSLSIGIYKKFVDREKENYERLQKLADKQLVSATELERAKSDYEISVARLEQAKRGLRYSELLVDLAETEYQQAVEANKVAPSAIPELEVKKYRIKMELAKAKLSELSE